MGVIGIGTEAWLYGTGIRIPREVDLCPTVRLVPCHARHRVLELTKFAKCEQDFGIICLLLNLTTYEVHVRESSASRLAAAAWAALWINVALSAMFDTICSTNIQATQPSERLLAAEPLHIIHYSAYGIARAGDHAPLIDETELVWFADSYGTIERLQCDERFEHALRALGHYRLNPHPAVQLATIWSGVEGLFRIDAEVSFRVALLASQFLGGTVDARQATFKEIRSLYRQRSKAVHGAIEPVEIGDAVRQSALLLRRLLKRCVALQALPNAEALVFRESS